MEFLYAADQKLGKIIHLLIPFCVILGILFPSVFRPIAPFTILLFAFMTFTNSLGAGFRDLGGVFLRPIPIAVTLLLLHLVMPLVLLFVGGLLFPGEYYLIAGMVLQFSIPTGVVSLMWVSMGRGNSPLTLSIVLLDTLLAPFLLPLILRLLLGATVEMDALGMMGDLVKMVALPALLAMLFHRFAGKERANHLKRSLSPFAKLDMLLITCVNSSGIAETVRGMNLRLLFIAGIMLAFCISGFIVGYLTARLLRLDFPTTVSVTLNTGIRNISAGSVIASQYFPAETLFPVVICTLFMQFTASLVIRVLRRTKAGQLEEARLASMSEDAAR